MGFAVPAVVGIGVRDMSSGAQLMVMPAAGLVEGAMLGIAQAVVLRRTLTGFNPRAWVVATTVAAALAWFLGMLPSTTHDTWSTWPALWVAVVAAVLGTALLASIGTAQALVLPQGTRGRGAWVGWTALGWCAGLTAFTIVTTPLWQPGQAAWLLVVIGVAGGLAMAAGHGGRHRRGRRAPRQRGRRRRDADAALGPGQHVASTLLGTRVYDASGTILTVACPSPVDATGDREQGPPRR